MNEEPYLPLGASKDAFPATMKIINAIWLVVFTAFIGFVGAGLYGQSIRDEEQRNASINTESYVSTICDDAHKFADDHSLSLCSTAQLITSTEYTCKDNKCTIKHLPKISLDSHSADIDTRP